MVRLSTQVPEPFKEASLTLLGTTATFSPTRAIHVCQQGDVPSSYMLTPSTVSAGHQSGDFCNTANTRYHGGRLGVCVLGAARLSMGSGMCDQPADIGPSPTIWSPGFGPDFDRHRRDSRAIVAHEDEPGHFDIPRNRSYGAKPGVAGLACYHPAQLGR